VSGSRNYKRYEDMSRDGFLQIYIQRDGDVLVIVRKEDDSRAFGTHVEFCTSGGKSPNTLKALYALAEAIKKDNEENPDIRSH
jgi:hypothetical protein